MCLRFGLYVFTAGSVHNITQDEKSSTWHYIQPDGWALVSTPQWKVNDFTQCLIDEPLFLFPNDSVDHYNWIFVVRAR